MGRNPFREVGKRWNLLKTHSSHPKVFVALFAQSPDELAKQAQNPVASLISAPFSGQKNRRSKDQKDSFTNLLIF